MKILSQPGPPRPPAPKPDSHPILPALERGLDAVEITIGAAAGFSLAARLAPAGSPRLFAASVGALLGGVAGPVLGRRLASAGASLGSTGRLVGQAAPAVAGCVALCVAHPTLQPLLRTAVAASFLGGASLGLATAERSDSRG